MNTEMMAGGASLAPRRWSLAALAIAFYVVVYTMILKRRTSQNIVWGGIAGCLPVLIGWAAVTNTLSWTAFWFFMVIFFWTPPHFWALALYRAEDYRRAGLPMLPVTHGPEFTRLQILLYTAVLLAVTMLPYAIRMSGLAYLASAVVLGAVFLPKDIQEAHVLGLFSIPSLLMLAAAGASWFTTKPEIHEANDFNFGPVKEVGYLFIGIFLKIGKGIGSP